MIIADLIKADDEKYNVIREHVKESKTIMIMQRTHQIDFLGYFLESGADFICNNHR